MKIAYFDCFAGISGDMLMGALIDAGASIEHIDGEYYILISHHLMDQTQVGETDAMLANYKSLENMINSAFRNCKTIQISR